MTDLAMDPLSRDCFLFTNKTRRLAKSLLGKRRRSRCHQTKSRSSAMQRSRGSLRWGVANGERRLWPINKRGQKTGCTGTRGSSAMRFEAGR
ncbi:MAG: hypothetical protein ACI9OJ_000955 [Myxococcota bacterium]|jgi:hypothetical protein